MPLVILFRIFLCIDINLDGNYLGMPADCLQSLWHWFAHISLNFFATFLPSFLHFFYFDWQLHSQNQIPRTLIIVLIEDNRDRSMWETTSLITHIHTHKNHLKIFQHHHCRRTDNENPDKKVNDFVFAKNCSSAEWKLSVNCDILVILPMSL